MKTYTSILVFLVIIACNRTKTEGQVNEPIEETREESITETAEEVSIPAFSSFSRDIILKNLQNKISNGRNLVAHIFVPLCDNEHQGIVPVNSQLGDGMNLRTNLYWGAGYGVKTHFKRAAGWEVIYDKMNYDTNILERIVFIKTFSNNAKCVLIADAFRGDRMQECLDYYFRSLAGKMKDSVLTSKGMVYTNSYADLLAFNGHNGLMDTDVDVYSNTDGNYRDAVVIACASDYYFNDKLNYVYAYPLVTTTNLLAPEAYVIKAIIENWAMLKTGEEIRLSAGDAYHSVQQCGQRGARALFRTGWVE